jgi:hypothetical protein
VFDQVSLRLPPDLVHRLDEYAAHEDLSRSAAATRILAQILDGFDGQKQRVAVTIPAGRMMQGGQGASGQTSESGSEAAHFGRHTLAPRLARHLEAQRIDGSPGNEFAIGERRVLLKGCRRSQLISTTEHGLRRNHAVIAALAIEPESNVFDVFELDAHIFLERSTSTPQGQRAVRASVFRNVGLKIGQFILSSDANSDSFIQDPARSL